MKRFFALIIFAFTLTSLSAWGIRVIGGGGGLGEMQIQSLFNRLQILSSLCLQPGAGCELTRDERKALKLLVDSPLFNTATAKISFFQEASPEEKFRYHQDDNDYVAISGNALYEHDRQPLSAPKLAALAFEAWTHRASVQALLHEAGLSHIQLETLAGKIFGRSKILSQTTELANNVLIHQINLKNGELYAGAYLYVERGDVTTDITNRLIEKVCRGEQSGRLLRVVRSSRQGAALDARIEWECGGQYWAGNAVIIPAREGSSVGITVNSLSQVRNCEIYIQ